MGVDALGFASPKEVTGELLVKRMVSPSIAFFTESMSFPNTLFSDEFVPTGTNRYAEILAFKRDNSRCVFFYIQQGANMRIWYTTYNNDAGYRCLLPWKEFSLL